MNWLVQDSPVGYGGISGSRVASFGYDSTPAPVAYGGGGGDYYDENIIIDDDVFSYDDDSDDLDDFDILDGGIIVSQQYRERGLDILSGGRDGFGAVKGVEKSGGGDMSYRGSAADVRVPGVVGDTGVIMGGNFASNGNSNVGGGPRRSSARYSGEAAASVVLIMVVTD
ncbi:hypothetical protein ACHAXA_004210 [Cyclostephanos tholiformis]|uniref:Uncharacterized protein n=1 Tax=Cyclostephanos tholiformis TaxID=382380 RepID=A0ABD3RFW8_9STRA